MSPLSLFYVAHIGDFSFLCEEYGENTTHCQGLEARHQAWGHLLALRRPICLLSVTFSAVAMTALTGRCTETLTGVCVNGIYA